VVMLRAFESLFAGFAVVVLLGLATRLLLQRLVPEWTEASRKLSAGFVFVNLGSSFLAAAAGGYVTAWAAENPLPHALALGIVVLIVAALSALQQRNKRPITYLLIAVASPPLGVVAGGLVRLRVEGIL
jgi:hypothetical protein